MPTVTPKILSGSTAIDDSYRLLSIEIRKEVDRIPHAEVRVLDGDPTLGVFTASNASVFAPGAQIEIQAQYEGQSSSSLFKGVVVRHGVEASADGSVLVLGLKDQAVALTGVRASAVYKKKSDSDIVKLLAAAASVKVGTIDVTAPQHVQIIQYNCTPWDFILSRSDVLGMVAVVEDGTLSLKKIALSGSATATYTYGIQTIYDLEIEADAEHQYAAVQSVAWDPATQQQTPLSKADSVSFTPSALDGAALGTAMGNATRTLSHPVPMLTAELGAWANARMARSRMALLRGRLGLPGTAANKLLDVIAIAGVGNRFNGNALVTGISHRIDGTGWRTDLQFGLSPEEYCRRQDLREARSAGLLPAVNGLQIGVVAAFEQDADGDGLRVPVLLPSVDMKSTSTVWARLASPDAGLGRGFYFRPEPGDEVVVGFFNDDPRCAVILGSLYSAKNTAPDVMPAPNADNLNRGIVTKGKTTLSFTDGDKLAVYLQTPKNNKLLLDDGDTKQVSLSDQFGNSIVMSQDKVVITSKQDLTIQAGGNIVIKGSKVDIQ